MAAKKKTAKSKTTKKTAPKKTADVKSVIAKSDDGTIQITFTIPFETIDAERKRAVKELSKDIEIPGFRKGKAPIDKAISQIPQNTLIEKTLSKILPGLVGDSIKEHELKPATYPKFELVKAVDGEDWQVRATTCELAEIELGSYKKAISASAKSKAIWTPGSDKSAKEGEKPDVELTRAQKEQEVMKALLETVKFDIPKILVEDEVNSRLSKLLERIEKLGLTLESYLASLGKTAESLREETSEQAKNSIKLDLILAKIAEKEEINIEKTQVDAAIKASGTDPNLAKQLDTPEQKRVVESILIRRAALDSLVSLI